MVISVDNRFSFPADDSLRYVLFLDIDGVLQPDQSISSRRFDIPLLEREEYPARISEKTGITHLKNLKWYDVAAVYLDWSADAVNNLRDILQWSGRKIEIILSSNWRESKSLEDMKALFAIHGLDGYLTGMCPSDHYCSKTEAIHLYLREHPDLNNYVILDDENLLAQFPGHAVYCDGWWLDNKIHNRVKRIFQTGFWWSHSSYRMDDDYEDGFERVIFLDIDGVLNKEDGGELIEERRVRLLRKIMLDRAGHINTELVICSSWKYGLRSWAEQGFPEGEKYKAFRLFINVLATYGLSIQDLTPNLLSGPYSRPLEIRTWLAHHGDVEQFVILDDDNFWIWGWLEQYVVYTRNEYKGKLIRGLEEDSAHTAMERLQPEKFRCLEAPQ